MLTSARGEVNSLHMVSRLGGFTIWKDETNTQGHWMWRMMWFDKHKKSVKAVQWKTRNFSEALLLGNLAPKGLTLGSLRSVVMKKSSEYSSLPHRLCIEIGLSRRQAQCVLQMVLRKSSSFITDSTGYRANTPTCLTLALLVFGDVHHHPQMQFWLLKYGILRIFRYCSTLTLNSSLKEIQAPWCWVSCAWVNLII